MNRILKLLTIILLLSPTLTRAQSTQPASGDAADPVKPKPTEKQVIDKLFGYSFNIPREWREIEQKGERSVHVFQLPASSGAAKAASSFIIFAEKEPKPVTLEQFTERMLASIDKRAKDAKIESQKEVKILGQDGWEIIYLMKMQMKVITLKGKQQTEQIQEVDARVRTTLLLREGYSYQLILTSDPSGFQNRTKMIDRMLTTFRFAATPPRDAAPDAAPDAPSAP